MQLQNFSILILMDIEGLWKWLEFSSFGASLYRWWDQTSDNSWYFSVLAISELFANGKACKRCF